MLILGMRVVHQLAPMAEKGLPRPPIISALLSKEILPLPTF